MFEEPEWAEAAPVAVGVELLTSRPRPTAAPQVKVSGPVLALFTV
jgi:hypothetical protein